MKVSPSLEDIGNISSFKCDKISEKRSLQQKHKNHADKNSRNKSSQHFQENIWYTIR
jgi:hypothetical protein